MCIVLTLSTDLAAADTITIDGTTTTTLNVGVDGALTITPAPKNSTGLSHNSYDSFNVPGKGVTFDNTATRASVIVNEVTSHNPSKIEGDVFLQGESADIIIANPNGIEVNGGAFIGWGTVTLGTGAMDYSGIHPELGVSGGTLSVTGNGLSSDGTTLNLFAKHILIDAEIDTGSGWLNMVGGNSNHILDTNHTLRSQFITSTASHDIAITISDGAILKGGRIDLRITDQGRGVKLAGNIHAGAQGLRVLASGDVSIGNLDTTSGGRVEIIGAALRQDTDTSAALTSTHSGVRLRATTGDIMLSDTNISAKTRDTASFGPLGAISLEAEGNIHIKPPAITPNLWQASHDAIGMSAGGDIEIDNTTLHAANQVSRISSDQNVTFNNISFTTNDRLSILASDTFRSHPSVLTADEKISIDAAEVSITSTKDTQASVISNAADVSLLARTGDITLSSAKIEGHQGTQNQSEDDDEESVKRGVSIISSLGRVIHRSVKGLDVGTIFSLIDEVFISAKNGIDNLNGVITSNSDITLQTDGDIRNQTLLSETDGTTLNMSERGNWFNKTNIISANYGTPLFGETRGRIQSGETLTLSAKNLDNIGGTLIGRNQVIDLDGALTSRSIITGDFWYKRNCWFFCRAKGEANIGILDGQIFASDTLTVTADTSVTSTGAVFLSGLNQSITSPRVGFNALLYPQLMLRPAGLSGLFGGSDGWVSLAYTGGYVGSSLGNLTITADDITFAGINPQIGGEEIYTVTPTRRIEPHGAGILEHFKIGLFER